VAPSLLGSVISDRRQNGVSLKLESNMIIFTCADCSEKINSADNEPSVEILDKLEEHVSKCPQATFTSEATTDAAQQRLNDLRAAIENLRPGGKVQLR
jgi:hypothetical protein